MQWMDWTKEGWRLLDAQPQHGQPISVAGVVAEDFILPRGSRTLLLRDAHGSIVHGYIALPKAVAR